MIITRPFRKPFWILKSFFLKHQKTILAAGVVGIVFFLLGKNLLPLLPQFRATSKIGVVGQYTLNSLPHAIANSFSRGLTQVDEKGLVKPDIAKSWEVLQEETIYRLYLNPDTFWSDGTPLISSDIKLELSNVEVSYPEDYIIEFKLKESYSPFLTLLSRPIFKNRLTVGPYTIKTLNYSGPYLAKIELVSSRQSLTYHFYPSHLAAWTGFRLGQVDTLKNLISNPLTGNWQSKVNLSENLNRLQYLAIIFNLDDPNLASKPLRQALAYALEPKSLSDQDRALTPINPYSWAYNPSVKPYAYNKEQALELFAKFSEEASVSGKLEITLGTSQTFLPLAEAIVKSWQETLNIDAKVKIVNAIDPGFQAILISQEIPLDPDQHALWHSTQPTNISHYSDLRVDKLLEDGRKISDLKKRQEIYRDFQRFLIEDLPAIFLRYPITYTISRK